MENFNKELKKLGDLLDRLQSYINDAIDLCEEINQQLEEEK